MTVLSLERLHLRPVGRSARGRLLATAAAWSGLVSRSLRIADAYGRAPTTSARHRVLAQFVDSGT